MLLAFGTADRFPASRFEIAVDVRTDETDVRGRQIPLWVCLCVSVCFGRVSLAALGVFLDGVAMS